MTITLTEPIDAAPFAAWVEAQTSRITADESLWTVRPGGSAIPPNASAIIGRRLGMHEDWIRKGAWRRTGLLERATIEDALDHAGVAWHDVFPAEDTDLEPDGFCGRCHEVVTPIAGRCPWCESTVTAGAGKVRSHCEACARMVYPRDDGSCWRCGSRTSPGVPYAPCACGCGAEKAQFDLKGRPVRYVRGHAPRSLEDGTALVDVEPFAQYLEQRLRDLDLLQALAREHGISRDDVVAVLARSEPKVLRKTVMRAIWIYARAGKGCPSRPDAVAFHELYPDDARSKVCPDCGGGKARHAQRCKSCNRKAKARQRRALTQTAEEA